MNNQFLPLGGRSHASLASRRTGGQEVAMAPLATRAGNEGTRKDTIFLRHYAKWVLTHGIDM